MQRWRRWAAVFSLSGPVGLTWATCALGASLAFCGDAVAAEGANQGFARAERLARAGNAKAALQVLSGLLKQYPAHQPSRALYAHLLYISGQQARAAKQYRVLGAEWATPSVAYEYGVSLFLAKDCKRAEQGLAKVPASSPEAGLAHFYRGVCAVRGRDYERAHEQLAQANELPPNLETQKRQALQIIREAQSRPAAPPPPEGAALSAGAAPYYSAAPSAPFPGGEDPSLSPNMNYPAQYPSQYPATGGTAGAAVPGPYDPLTSRAHATSDRGQSRWVYAVASTFTATQSTALVNYFGFKNAESDTSSYNLTGEFQAKYALGTAPVPGQSYIVFTADAREKIASISGTATTYQYSASAPGTLFSNATLTPPGGIRFFGLRLGSEYRHPLSSVSNDAEAYAGYWLGESLPDNQMTNANTSNKPYVGVFIPWHKYILSARLSYTLTTLATAPAAGPVSFYDSYTLYSSATPFYDPQQQIGGFLENDNPRQNTFGGSTTSFDSALERDWDSVSTKVHLNYISYSPSSSGYILTGQESSHLLGDVSAVKKFPYGFSLLFTATYAELMGYTQFVTASGSAANGTSSTVQASTAGTVTKLRGELLMAPIEWLYVYGTYEQDSYSFSGVQPSLLTSFEAVAPQQATSYGIQVGVRKTF